MRKPFELRATAHPRQYWVEGRTDAKEFDDYHVCFSGYFGDINPNVFAAARELYDAAKGLAAVGIINPTGSEKVEAASQALFEAIRLAERDVPPRIVPEAPALLAPREVAK